MGKKSKVIVLLSVILTEVVIVFYMNGRKEQLVNERVKKRNIITDATEISKVRDKFVNVELEYLGSAKVGETKEKKENLFIMRGEPYSDNGLLYTYSGYRIFAGDIEFDIYKEKFNLFGFDFNTEYRERQYYVMSFGRKLEWLQYNPEWYTQFGSVANRAGLAWDDEIDSKIIYVYKFPYDIEKYGGLACMPEEY